MNLKNTKQLYLIGKIHKDQYIDEMYKIHSLLFEYSQFLKDADIKSLEITDEGVTVTFKTNDLKFMGDPRDRRMPMLETINFGAYDKIEIHVIKNLLKDGCTIFDVGANYGWYSLTLSRILPNAQIFAFEPIPATFKYLEKNICLNRCKGIKAFNHGLSNESKSIDFYFNPEQYGNASLVNVSDHKNVQVISSSVKRLDEVVLDHNVRPDFIKCDVEGAELLVFQGGYETIKKHQPIIFTEMLRRWAGKFNYHPNQIISLLSNLGYRCFIINNGHLKEFFEMDDNTLETNFFFLHREKHKSQLLGIWTVQQDWNASGCTGG